MSISYSVFLNSVQQGFQNCDQICKLFKNFKKNVETICKRTSFQEEWGNLSFVQKSTVAMVILTEVLNNCIFYAYLISLISQSTYSLIACTTPVFVIAFSISFYFSLDENQRYKTLSTNDVYFCGDPGFVDVDDDEICLFKDDDDSYILSLISWQTFMRICHNIALLVTSILYLKSHYFIPIILPNQLMLSCQLLFWAGMYVFDKFTNSTESDKRPTSPL